MLTLNDGRNELWQWDTGRKLTVDADCSQVHFSNKVFGRSIDVDVVDGIAIIPDILLQTDKDLTAWAFVGTPENGYTKISKVFKVNRRNKPADYVFTPPEQTMLDELVERLDKIEESQDPDAIKNALEDYLDQNPVEAPVQSVNGKTGKVKLTAEDVGAISQEDLQEATNEALAQAKASGEFDGKDGIDGYTPIKGVDYFDGEDGQPGANGKDGQDYVLTEADKQEIAEQAAQLVEVPEGGEIPDALPNPYALTFTGAVNATYDGSKAVSVEIPRGVGGGSGATPYYKVASMTTEEEVKEIKIPLSAEAIAKLNAAEAWLFEILMSNKGSTVTDTTLGKLSVTTFTTYNTNTLISDLGVIPVAGVSYASQSSVSALYRKGIISHAPNVFVSFFTDNYGAKAANTTTYACTKLTKESLRITGSCNIPSGTKIAFYAVGEIGVIE